ncbi:HAD-IA family hydrolase [Candidatus Bipolaricaulota bacterium]|nr:HAD-IA family hydrolase [Candidatus Bipolaricaulota bacterium]
MVRSAVLFDLDGTLWNAPIDWRGIRDAMGLCFTGEPILQQIMGLAETRRKAALAILQEHESRGVSEGTLIAGAGRLFRSLRSAGVLCGLVSNNARKNVDAVLRLTGLQFDAVFSRDEVPSKPAPEGFIAAMRQLQVEAENAAMVGDTHLDAVAAHAAGIRRIILVSPPAWSADLIPENIHWQLAPDLEAVRRRLMSDLPRPGFAPPMQPPNEETNHDAR